MEKKILAFLLSAVIMLCMVACSTSEVPNNAVPKETPSQPVQDKSVEAAESDAEEETDAEEEGDGTVKSGSYTLPCGMKIQFYDSVRNDKTGNWKRSTTSDNYVPADYALEYYDEMFSSDDEIHSIWNATLGTNTRITAAFGMLYVDTLEYVKGEEHDANLMFSGDIIDSKMINIETGEIVE